MARRCVLLIGGTGVFGQRLARHLATIDGLDLIVTSRSQTKARDLAATIATAGTKTLRGVGLDHRHDLDRGLAELAPWLVIDASGPFQGAGYAVPRAALAAGAHVVDLADARDYISGYGAALDGLAKARGLVGLAGASSTPALSAAAVTALTAGWRRIDTVDIAITPGGRSEVGEAVIAAILSYAGRPIPIWREGALQETHGWRDDAVVAMPGLGRRRVAAVETVDAQGLGPALDVRSRVAFRAGLESRIEQAGVMALAALRKAGLLGSPMPLIPLLLAARKLTRIPTSDRGGMLVAVTGLDRDSVLQHAQWSLLAEKGDGPHVPTLPAAAAVRALMTGGLASGARSAAGALSLEQIEAEMAPYAIATCRDARPHGASVFQKALGADVHDALPAALRALHGPEGPPVWHGSADVETGSNPLVKTLCRIIGLPPAGRDVPLSVTVERRRDERGACEIWTRNFDGRRFSSLLATDDEGVLRERFGPASFVLGLVARDSGLEMPVTSARLFGIPLPRFLLPVPQAREEMDDTGRFRFDVRLTLPVLGLLTHYRGWLAPADCKS